MMGQNPKNTRASLSDAPDTAFVLWSYETGDSISSSPVVTPYYDVCVPSLDGYLYCFYGVDGTLRWTQQIGPDNSWRPNPIAAGLYKVVVGSADGYLHCFSTLFHDGALVWSTQIGGHIGELTISGDKLFVGTSGDHQYGSYETLPNYLYAIDLSTGTILWSCQIGATKNDAQGGLQAPAVDAGKVFIGAHNVENGAGGHVYCLDEATGSLVWDTYVLGKVYSSPVIVDDHLFITTAEGYIKCLHKLTGDISWSRDLSDVELISSLACTAERIFVGTSDGKMLCVHENHGNLLWSYQTGDAIGSSPAVTDGKVYFGSSDGYFYCLNMVDGSLIWRYQTSGSSVVSSPAISGDRVFVGAHDNYLYCFGTLPLIYAYQWPTASIDSVSPTPATEDDLVSFRGHGSDPDGSIVAYEWVSSIDGHLSTLSEFGTHSLSIGTHTIFFHVQDNHDIWSAKATTTLTITETPNLAPTASFTVSSTTPELGQNVELTDQSQDPEGETLLYDWDFGDGTGSAERNPSHQYGQAQSYTITLTVTDDDGATDTFSISITVEEKSPCLIATATYGSELSPQVQFLRDFRDDTVLSTFAGKNFMTVFNGVYYSFSPSVASVINDNADVKFVMKELLYPLISILQVSSATFSVFSFLPELGVIIAGLIASALIGISYFFPIGLIVWYFRKFTVSEKLIHQLGLLWVSSISLLAVAEVLKSPSFMMVSTGSFVLVTMATATLTSLRIISKRLIH
jgi:outer membrane protein assembly factor BamB